MYKFVLRKIITAAFTSMAVMLWILCGCAAGAEESSGGHYVEKPAVSESSVSDAGEDLVSEKKLTLMIYLCGSNLESGGGAATSDLYEIQHSFVNREEVNVVVAAGGTKEWKNTFSSDETAIYELGNFNTWNKAENLYADEDKGIPANMGEQSTLLALLNYAWENDPAEEYALIFWDHGGGPMSGVCWDMQWAGNNLSMQELCGALEESPFAGKKLAWVGFDACLMASLETAHMMAPYASYMIASEETEPASGWNYSFMKDIENDTDGGVTGERIVESYFEGSEDSGAGITLSCMDLSRITDLEEKLGAFFSELSGKLNEKTFSNLSNRRYRTHEFGRAEEDDQHLDLVDLGDLIRNYAPYAVPQSRDLLNALDQFVVCSRSSIPQCNGISIYHPYYNKLFYQKLWKDTFQSVGVSSSYADYLQSFARIWMDSALGEWEDLSGVRTAGEAGEEQIFSFHLTEDQMEHFAYAQLLILSEASSDVDGASDPGYARIFTSERIQPDENAILTIPYGGKTLYVVNDRNEPVVGPIGYSVTENGHIQILANYLDTEGRTDESITYTMFECEPAEPGTDLTVLEHYVYDEEIGSFSNRRSILAKNYSRVNFLHDYRRPTYKDGQLIGFQDWEDSEWLGGHPCDLPLDFHFRFFDSLLDNEQLYACFQISDTQSVVHSSELIAVETVSESPLIFEDDTYEDEQLRLTVSGKLVHTELSRYLELTVNISNLTDRKLSIDLFDGDVVANQVRSLRDSDSWELEDLVLEPGETYPHVYEFVDYNLSGLSEINEIKFYMTCRERPVDYMEEDDSEPVEKELVFVPQKLDVSAAAGHCDEAEPLAEYEEDGLYVSLISLEEDNSGNLTGILGFRNLTGERYRQRLDTLIVDGIVIDLESVGQVTLPDGTDTYLSFVGRNYQDYWGYFDSKPGTSHMILSDVLGAEGLDEIHSLVLCDTKTREGYYLEDEDDSITHDGQIPLTMSTPFPYEKKTDTQKPERTEICTIGDVVISGESVLLADRSVVLSLALENQGAEDEKVLFDTWFFNETQTGYSPDEYLVPAGTVRRVYIDQSDYSEEAGDELLQVSFRCRTESGGVPGSMDVASVFKEPFTLGGDSYVECGFADTEVTVSGLDLPESSGPFFAEEIICPDQMGSYRQKLSFDLPEELLQEDAPSVEFAAAGIMRDLTNDPEYLTENEESGSADPVFQTLAWVPLAEDKDSPGRYSGMFSGLLLVSEKYPAKNFRLQKRSSAFIAEGTYELAEMLNLNPLDELDPNREALLALWADLSIGISYDSSGEGTAQVENFSILNTTDDTEDMASWPSSYFKDMTSEDGAHVYSRNEDGSIGEPYAIYYLEELDLPLDGEPVSLKLIPAGDYSPDIVLLYMVQFSDGSVAYYEGGAY